MKGWYATCTRCGSKLMAKTKLGIWAEMKKHRKACNKIRLEAFNARMLAAGVDVTTHAA